MRAARPRGVRAFAACMLALHASGNVQAADRPPGGGALAVAVSYAGAVDPVRVHVVLHNGSAEAVAILRWQLPEAPLTHAVLAVTRDGQPVRYVGLRASRPPPTPNDYRTLAPGERLAYTVDLSRNYALTEPGDYHVRYATERLAHALRMPLRSSKLPALASSAAWIRLHAATVDRPVAYAVAAKGSGQLSFTASCSNGNRLMLAAAVDQARQYAALGRAYYAAQARGARHAQWFGAYDPSRYVLAAQRMAAIEAATAQANLDFECIPAQSNCPGSNVVAYVSPMSAYRIYVCPRLYDYPLLPAPAGYAQSGAIIHEVSHFYAVDGGTDDFVYGYAQSANFAATNPGDALRNADSWMYFSMNQPALESDGRAVFRSGFE